VRFKQLGLPLPGALGIFSGTGDFSRAGDSLLLYPLEGFPGELPVIDPSHAAPDEYYGKTDPKDQVLSPFLRIGRACRRRAGDEHAGYFVERDDHAAQEDISGG